MSCMCWKAGASPQTPISKEHTLRLVIHGAGTPLRIPQSQDHTKSRNSDNAGSMLRQRRRRWRNIDPALSRYPGSAGILWWSQQGYAVRLGLEMDRRAGGVIDNLYAVWCQLVWINLCEVIITKIYRAFICDGKTRSLKTYFGESMKMAIIKKNKQNYLTIYLNYVRPV